MLSRLLVYPWVEYGYEQMWQLAVMCGFVFFMIIIVQLLVISSYYCSFFLFSELVVLPANGLCVKEWIQTSNKTSQENNGYCQKIQTFSFNYMLLDLSGISETNKLCQMYYSLIQYIYTILT